MLIGGLIVGGLIILAILVGRRLRYMGEGYEEAPSNRAPEPVPMYGYYSAPPEHGQQQPDDLESTYTECPSCGKRTYREWLDTWVEQFGQGTTSHENVLHWECTNCGISGHE